MSLFLSMCPSVYVFVSAYIYLCVFHWFCPCLSLCISMFQPIFVFASLSLFAQSLVSSPKNSQPLSIYLLFCPSSTTPYTYLPFSLRKSPYLPGFCTCTLGRYFYSRFSTILAFGIIAIILFKIWANPDLFFHLFLVFSIKIYKFLQQIYVKKCQSTTRCQDLNPQPSECESPPITIRPLLLFFPLRFYFSLLIDACLLTLLPPSFIFTFPSKTNNYFGGQEMVFVT